MYAFSGDRNAAIRAWAKGIYPTEAGAELLVRTHWAETLDKAGYLEASENPRYELAYPRVGAFLRHAGYLSGGERRQLSLIAGFLHQDVADDGQEGGDRLDDLAPVSCSLYEDLPGVDRSFIRLVMSAVGHAAGLHEAGGNPLPWPEEDL